MYDGISGVDCSNDFDVIGSPSGEAVVPSLIVGAAVSSRVSSGLVVSIAAVNVVVGGDVCGFAGGDVGGSDGGGVDGIVGDAVDGAV